MLTRRVFVACAFCAAGGFMATGAEAQTPGLKRTLIKQTDGPMDGYVTVEVKIEIEPGRSLRATPTRASSSDYVVEGSVELTVDGEGTRTYSAGDGFQIPTGVPHSGKNGPAKTVLAATYVVEKGKPLASPA